MTSLVLGVVGAGIGFLVGGPVGAQIGFLAGSLIGNLIDPPKIQGPRLNDLKLQAATYGKMIPFFWGTGRIAGNIIDQTDLEEHTQKSGGKGGPVTTNYTYSASFAILLGAARRFGEPAIRGILRIWADGRLIWDQATGEPCPCTVYLGDQTQLPDPTFEAIHGVGNVPAYLGRAYVVFSDYFLTDFGNRIPSFEFEVFTGSGFYPWQIAAGDPWHDGPFGSSVFSYVYEDGKIITVGSQAFGGYVNLYYSEWDLALNQIGSTVTTQILGVNVAAVYLGTKSLITVDASLTYRWATPDASGVFSLGTDISGTAGGGPGTVGGTLGVTMDGYCYSVTGTGPCTVNKYEEGGGLVATATVDATLSANDVAMGTSDTGDVYIVDQQPGTGLARMWKLDSDLNILKAWTSAELTPILLNMSEGCFTVYKDQLCFSNKTGPTTFTIRLVNIGAAPGYTLTDDAVHFMPDGVDGGRVLVLSGGIMLDIDAGVFSLDPPAEAVLLSTIVADLSDMTPLNGAYDVAELTDEVNWFVIAQQMPVRNALQLLRQGFFFDAVESDDVVKFRKRDLSIGSPAREIIAVPDDDLCAREFGQAAGDPLRTTRKKEQDLPRTVSINYIDIDTDYQIGTQSTPRQTTLSQQDVSIEMPIGFTATQALQKCWTLMTAEWVERETFEWATTRKWAYLEPTDVVYVRGRVIRIQTKTEQPNGVITWGGVLASPSLYNPAISSIYVQSAPGSGGGFVPPEPPGPKVATRMILMDLPLIDDTDFPNGFYAAIAPATSGSWTGAEIYESSDGGTTYASVASGTNADTIGSISSGALGNWTGGNNFDESNTFTVVLTSGTLSSASETAVLNGANMCAVGSAAGWEIIQFTTATMTAANTYTISGLLRGRRGTEWMQSAHVAAETFVLLPTTININGPYAELLSPRKFKGISFGQTLASVTAVDFTNNGVALLPYAPVALGGGWEENGDLSIRWLPRSRIGGTWLEGAEVTLSDPDLYQLNFYSDSTFTTQVFGDAATGNGYRFLEADIATYYGSPTPLQIYFEVAQLGSLGYGYFARGHAP